MEQQFTVLLKDQIEDISHRYPALKEDQLFALWFLRAYLTESEEAARDALTGGPGDKGIDAVLIDDGARVVFLVQTKYRLRSPGKPEGRSEVLAFANTAALLAGDKAEDLKAFLRSANGATQELLGSARKRIQNNRYRLRLNFVSLGSFSNTLERDARQCMRGIASDVALELIGEKRLELLLRDYLDGAAPPIPSVDLEMERGQGVRVNGVLQRFDTGNEIESWVFSIRGNAVAELVETSGKRVFARNIRGFLGESVPVNRDMWRTLRDEPDHFFYFNNGITIACDRAERLSHRGTDVLRISNPQIINGQQTSRVLAQHPDLSAKATVLVKVIQIPRRGDRDDGGFEHLVSKIVQGTNWQTAIRASDLVSNDRRQIDLERAFRRLGYGYLRKRQTKGEAVRSDGAKARYLIKKEDLAQAIAGCDLDPVVARSGKDNLFGHDLYGTVFPTSDPDYYLTRHWLAHTVSAGSRGFPQRGYMKWLALRFLWTQVGPKLRSARSARAFRILNERRADDLIRPLSRAVDALYRDIQRYYKNNKGAGETAVDVSTFFRNRRGRDRDFAEFWARRRNPSARIFRAGISRAIGVLESYED